MFNEVFWIGVGFFMLLGLFVRFGAVKAINAGLDQRTSRIREELEEAKRLRQEADALLKEFINKRTQAEAEAAKIIEDAKKEADMLMHLTNEKLADFLASRTASAEIKIAQDEKLAIESIRKTAADAAIMVSEHILKQEFAGSDMANTYLDNEIAHLKSGFAQIPGN